MSEWTNDKQLNLRSRIALKLLLLAIKVVEPYQFGHQFEEDYKKLNDLIDGKPEEPKAAKK